MRLRHAAAVAVMRPTLWTRRPVSPHQSLCAFLPLSFAVVSKSTSCAHALRSISQRLVSKLQSITLITSSKHFTQLRAFFRQQQGFPHFDGVTIGCFDGNTYAFAVRGKGHLKEWILHAKVARPLFATLAAMVSTCMGHDARKCFPVDAVCRQELVSRSMPTEQTFACLPGVDWHVKKNS